MWRKLIYEFPRECGRNTAEVRVFPGLEAAVLVERQERGREEKRGERQKEGETVRAEREGRVAGLAGEEPRSWGQRGRMSPSAPPRAHVLFLSTHLVQKPRAQPLPRTFP